MGTIQRERVNPRLLSQRGFVVKVTCQTPSPYKNVRLYSRRCPPSSTLSRRCGWTNVELLVS